MKRLILICVLIALFLVGYNALSENKQIIQSHTPNPTPIQEIVIESAPAQEVVTEPVPNSAPSQPAPEIEGISAYKSNEPGIPYEDNITLPSEGPAPFVKPTEPPNLKDENISQEEYNKIMRTILTPKQLAEYMHMMANSAIVAEGGNIKGIQPLTVARSRIFYDIYEQNGIYCNSLEGYTYFSQVWSIAPKWMNDDFTHIVEDHNYLWEILGKPDGKAIKVK